MQIIKSNRNLYLDCLRSISALLVLFFHYTARYDMLFGHIGNYPIVAKHGSFAVLMFFLLSGYLTFKGLNRYKTVKFINNRFLRLFPSFWLCLIISFVLVTAFLPELSVSIKDFLLNFTMIPLCFGADYVDGAYWTLSCEILFYIFILVVLLLKGEKYGQYIILGWFVVQIGIILLPEAGLFALVKKINKFLYFHCFMAGGVIAVLECSVYKKKKGTIAKIISFALLIALMFFVAQQYIDHDKYSGLFMAISIVSICVSIFIFNRWGNFYWAQKVLAPVAWIASISYPMYLLHQNIGYMIINRMERAGLTNEWFLLFPITIVLLAAWLVHKYVEQPCISMGKNK